ncbi:thioesterase domain-containing protein, partial [Pseudozobellia sp. WGM2]|uniref:thioesterase domain-containing protein n=1 Tax=Pseudozobellia sp. WGM2 TaxID=2787625 RepID=UPI001FD7FDC2
TEKQLAAIWQEVLGREKIGIKDDFFEMGGHSLNAIKVIARINKTLDSEINLNTLFEHSTISEFVEKISSRSSFNENILVPVQEKGNQKEIYLAPPVSGTIDCYIRLAKQLGEFQPLYAFQSPGLYGKLPISKSIEKMASIFITEMQKINPNGPYRLGGYSFGGTVAYEMALQLQKKGFEVEELIIFDKSPLKVKAHKVKNIDQDQTFRELIYNTINKVSDKEFHLSDLSLEGKSRKELIDSLCKFARDSKYKMNEAEIRRRFEIRFRNQNYKYKFKNEEKLNTTVVLFRAMYKAPFELTNKRKKDKKSFTNDLDDYGWKRFTSKEVIVHPIPCNHSTILDSNYLEQISKLILKKIC